MCDQEVQSHAFVAETSNVYCAVVVEVDVEGKTTTQTIRWGPDPHTKGHCEQLWKTIQLLI